MDPWNLHKPHKTPAGRTIGKNTDPIFPRSCEECERCDVGTMPQHHLQAVIPPRASWKLSLVYFDQGSLENGLWLGTPWVPYPAPVGFSAVKIGHHRKCEGKTFEWQINKLGEFWVHIPLCA